MRGIIFVNLVEHLETELGFEAADAILEAADLGSGGAYTSVGSYPVDEAFRIVAATSERTGIPASTLLRGFGKVLFGVLAGAHPEFLKGVEGPVQLLQLVEGHIHKEVRKLYPEAKPARFEAVEGRNGLFFIYRSDNPLGDLCEGLIRGCFAWFDQEVHLSRTDMSSGNGTEILFQVVTEPVHA
jgi:hypothetical protein